MRLLGEQLNAKPLLADDPPPELRAELLRHAADRTLADELWRSVTDATPSSPKRRAMAWPDWAWSTTWIGTACPPAQRLAALLILREYRVPGGASHLPSFWRDPDAAVRFAAIQWVGEERLAEFREPLVEALSAGPATARLFGGYLSALERLDGMRRIPSNEWAGEQYIVRALDDPKTPAAARRWALRMLRPDHPALTLDRLRGYLQSDDEALRLEAVRTLRDSSLDGHAALLAEIAGSDAYAARLRAEAIVGLTPERQRSEPCWSSSPRATIRHCGPKRCVRCAGRRSTRTSGRRWRPWRTRIRPRPTWWPGCWCRLPRTNQTSRPRLRTPTIGSACCTVRRTTSRAILRRARRIFFHRQSAACARCHQIGGRGAKVGPELTATTGTLSERRLVESIVRPAQEVAPQFVAWLVVTTSGQSITGVLVHEEATGEQTYADAQGKLTELKPDEIEARRALPTSIMPEGLPRQMTVQEFRDLVAFLRSAGGEETSSAEPN